MKKTVILFIILLCAMPAFAYKFAGLPWSASQPVMETGGRNYLPWNALELEGKYGINVHIFRFPARSKIDSEHMATGYYNTLTRTPEDKILLVWVNKDRGTGHIIASDTVQKMLPEGSLEILQDEVLRPFINRWLINEQRLYSKILGTLVYMLEKPQDGVMAGWEKGRFIRIDDPLYRISLAQPFRDIISLFYFEPITFVLYFPFIMYMFLVRLIGMNSGKLVFWLFNLLWVILTGFIFVLILNRVNIIFPEYVSIFTFFTALNLPLYMVLFILYQDRVEAAAYAYLHNVTGGFASGGDFGGMK